MLLLGIIELLIGMINEIGNLNWGYIILLGTPQGFENDFFFYQYWFVTPFLEDCMEKQWNHLRNDGFIKKKNLNRKLTQRKKFSFLQTNV